MNHYLLLLLTVLPVSNSLKGSGSISYHPAKTIHVQFNKNLEFMGFIYHLGWIGPDLEENNPMIHNGGEEIPETEWRSYGYKIYREYKKFAGSKHLDKIIEIASPIDYSPLIDLMMLTEDFPNATLNKKITDDILKGYAGNGNPEDGKQMARQFLDALNAFYVEVDFDNYLETSKAYYDRVMEQVQDAMPAEGFIENLESFYRQEFKSYNLIPVLLLPAGMGFGPRYGEGSDMEIYNIFGPQSTQVLDHSQLDLGFGDEQRMMELSVHEFGHSFVNPIVDQLPDSMIAQTEFLFDTIRQAMDSQGYPGWKTCLYEHFVRAGEVVIARSMGLEENAENLRQWYIRDRKFIYLPLIIDELENYREGEHASYLETVFSALNLMTNAGVK